MPDMSKLAGRFQFFRFIYGSWYSVYIVSYSTQAACSYVASYTDSYTFYTSICYSYSLLLLRMQNNQVNSELATRVCPQKCMNFHRNNYQKPDYSYAIILLVCSAL